jgi:hypothetical protein
MLTLLVRRDNPRKPRSYFIVRIKGYGNVSEKAPCADEAIGTLARKHASKFRGVIHDIRVIGTTGDYYAYLENSPADVFGLGYSYDSAVGAMIRLNPEVFKTFLEIKPENNSPKKPR